MQIKCDEGEIVADFFGGFFLRYTEMLSATIRDLGGYKRDRNLHIWTCYQDVSSGL